MSPASFAGSINQSGMLEIEAKKVGNDTNASADSTAGRRGPGVASPSAAHCGQSGKVYVPAALALAAVVWAATGSVVRGITVLIVFCPCALVLAIPTAIVDSIGHAARRLILVKGGEFAETVGQIHVVAWDKTGTLTTGKPSVTKVVQLDSVSTPEIWRLAASAEPFSEHPISAAIRRAAEEPRVGSR